MNFNKAIYAIDSHTMGEPTRIIISGIPFMPGKTILEKKQYLENELDYIRKLVLLEPRGHKDMFGAVIVEPTNKNADIGVIFMDGKGYIDMCVHGSMGVATVAIEYGLVPSNEPYTEVKMESLAGLIKAKVNIEKGKIKNVSIQNVPSFLYRRDFKINVPQIGDINLDISFGGNFFAIVDCKDIGIKLESSNINLLSKLGIQIREIVNDNLKIKHPYNKQIKDVKLVEFFDESKKADLKNLVIFGQGQYDRSPCGTGTSAKLASLYSRGLIREMEEFRYESILGTIFKGKIIGTLKIENYKAIIPEITGSSFITGFNNFVIDPDDPFKYGFYL
jgi:proline racemase/trans-L-3-hydroxyproline dehydratase